MFNLKNKIFNKIALILSIAFFINALSLVFVSPAIFANDCKKDEITLGVPITDENGNEVHCLKKDPKNESNNPIFVYMRTIVRFLAAGVGAVSVLMIVISGVQYITSSGNPDATQAAKKRLTNAVIALVLFIFMAAILNFLIPGGIL